MATSKIQTPQPAIFNTDPEEQIYARGTLDRDMSGLSFMFKNAAEDRRKANSQQYMQGVSEANKIAQALAQQEMQQEMMLEGLKQGPKYAEAGLPIHLVQAIAQNFAGGGQDDQTRLASMLVNLKAQADIAAKNASAAASGQAGADKWTADGDSLPGGEGAITIKGQGRDPEAIRLEMIKQMQLLRAAREKGGPLAPKPIEKWGTGGTNKSIEYDPNKKIERKP